MTRAGVVLVLATSMLLTGCSAPAISGGTDGTNDQSGGSGPVPPEDTSAPQPGSGVTEGALPADFPSDIPVIDGPVLVAVDLGTGWALWIGADDPATAFERATAALEAAGFTQVAKLVSDASSIASYSSESYQVQLMAGDDPTHGSAVSYTIIRN